MPMPVEGPCGDRRRRRSPARSGGGTGTSSVARWCRRIVVRVSRRRRRRLDREQGRARGKLPPRPAVRGNSCGATRRRCRSGRRWWARRARAGRVEHGVTRRLRDSTPVGSLTPVSGGAPGSRERRPFRRRSNADRPPLRPVGLEHDAAEPRVARHAHHPTLGPEQVVDTKPSMSRCPTPRRRRRAARRAPFAVGSSVGQP